MSSPINSTHYAKLYTQNGEHIVTIDFVTSLHLCIQCHFRTCNFGTVTVGRNSQIFDFDCISVGYMASKLLFPGGDLHHHLIHGTLCRPQSIYPNRHLDRFSCFRRSHGYAQMSAWQGSAVPCRLLHTGHRCRRQAATQVSHTATDGGATTSAIHCWTRSIRCAWPHGRTPCRTTSAHSRTMSPLDRA